MGLEKRTTLNQIECKPDGKLFVRLSKEIVDDNDVISSEFHRFEISANADVQRISLEVGHHLNTLGFPPLSKKSVKKIITIYEANKCS